ncbi:MAG: hypothetical protein H0X11_13995 [Betaproteobacteria bacterium]|nr:hypothetical protein [Betaproteobacteria bacterium]
MNAHESLKPVAAGAAVAVIVYYLSAHFVAYIEFKQDSMQTILSTTEIFLIAIGIIFTVPYPM